MNKVDLQITGMTCAACSARIEKTLLRIDGVIEAGVNLATASATVQWEGPSTGAEEIIGRIQKLGYGATRRDKTESTGFRLEARDYRNRFLLALVLSLPLLVVMLGHGYEPLASVTPELFTNAYFQLVLGSLLTSYAGYPFYSGAYQALKQGMPNMDVLVALSISGAYLYSQYQVFQLSETHGGGHYYFDSIAMVLTSVTFGKWMEAIAKGNALRSLSSLYELRSETATLILPSGVQEQVPVSELRVGNILSVETGEGIPTDGVVTEGIAEIEESLLTGESLLVIRKSGDRVYAGTRIVSGRLFVRAVSSPSETLLSRMISFVEEAQQSKPRIQRRIDLIAAYFVPAILAVAAATYVAWANLSSSADAFGVAMAVLLVACPCALGLATPVSILIGSGMAARSGIIVKEGAMIETLSRADTFVFDKTGTLTEGKPTIADIRSDRLPAVKLLKLAASLEQHSDHPFAMAIVREAQARGLALSPAEGIELYPGKGMAGVVDRQRILIGHSRWLDELGYKTTKEERMDSRLHIVMQDKLAGSISFKDPLREDAATTLGWLKSRGTLWLATGDGESAAGTIAAQAGIRNIRSRMLPEEKLALVRRLQREGRIVAMVGDGANDSASLAAANIGIAIAGGNDAALQSGDIVIVGGRLAGIQDAVVIAKRTMRNIRQNLGLALFYNAIMIPLAAMGMLDPRTACICMASSSVLVVCNSLRLKRMPIGSKGKE